MNTEKIYKEHQETIVDLRSPEEFWSRNFAGSINIPLQQIQQRIDELKNLKAPLILCCVSGNRSDLATKIFNRQGIDCRNGSSWLDINYKSETI